MISPLKNYFLLFCAHVHIPANWEWLIIVWMILSKANHPQAIRTYLCIPSHPLLVRLSLFQIVWERVLLGPPSHNYVNHSCLDQEPWSGWLHHLCLVSWRRKTCGVGHACLNLGAEIGSEDTAWTLLSDVLTIILSTVWISGNRLFNQHYEVTGQSYAILRPGHRIACYLFISS